MSEFHDDYPQYELMAHHSEEEGKATRKKLWKVFWVLLVVTIIELLVGYFNQHFGDLTKKFIFIFFTVFKAFFIVYSFMHLGNEKKFMRYVIILPFCVFILYLVFVVITEGSYNAHIRDILDPLLTHFAK